MQKDGYNGDVLLLHSGGGVMTAKGATKFAARLAASGIAAGAIASRFISELAGYKNSISLDMGGTSTDISLCSNGDLHVTNDWHVEYGYPIRFPSVEVLTIGAGGGSLAWRDAAGALRNGPQSAGSMPGPVCYNQGGTEPTNCDANVILGRLGTKLAGGKVELDVKLPRGAIDRVIAKPFGMETGQAALCHPEGRQCQHGGRRPAGVARERATTRVTSPLVAFGGAGALHGVPLARDLHIPVVLIPPNPGVTSALGCLLVDITHDISADVHRHRQRHRHEEAERRLPGTGGRRPRPAPDGGHRPRPDAVPAFHRHALSGPVAVDVDPGQRRASKDLDAAVEKFHEEHGRAQLLAAGRTGGGVPHPGQGDRVEPQGGTGQAQAAQGAAPGSVEERMVRFDEAPKRIKTPVYDRSTAACPAPSSKGRRSSTSSIPPSWSRPGSRPRSTST